MNHRILLKTSFPFFQRTNLFCKWFFQPASCVYFKYANINVYLSKQSFYVSSQCFLKSKRRRAPEPVILKIKSSKEVLKLYEDINLKELSLALKEEIDTLSDFIFNLNEKNLKYVDKPDMCLDRKLVIDVSTSYGYKLSFIKRPKIETDLVTDVEPQPPPPLNESHLRAPVVTIMGHVDHGKTTLLDALRNSRLASQEFGGITQHIGAFSVTLKSNQKVTFLDTPGHSAFKAMRERGARSTDIVVLVVAADDGVKDQTVESIKYAKEAGVPIVVAINKCDKPTANPTRTKEELMYHDIVVESMGGDVQAVEISALYSKNLDKLQEALITQAEIMNLRSTSNGLVEGVIIETSVIQGLGKVCTMIVNRGTLKHNAFVLAGTVWGRVKTMHDEFNKPVNAVGPSCPVRISGWRDELPCPGDTVFEVKDELKAHLVAEFRKKQKIKIEFAKDWKEIEEKRIVEREKYIELRKIRLEKGLRYDSAIRKIIHKQNPLRKEQPDINALPKLAILLRCDVDGTLEAIIDVLQTYNSQLAELDIVDFGVGAPTDANILLAKEFDALIYCFNVYPSNTISQQASGENVKIKNFNVIYKLVDDLKNELTNILPTIYEYKLIGEGHVLKQFLISDGLKKKQPIAGCLVDSGIFDKTKIFRFFRKDQVIYEGNVQSLKCESEFVSTASKNIEVGVSLADKSIRFKPDDNIEVFEENVVVRTIDWNPPGF